MAKEMATTPTRSKVRQIWQCHFICQILENRWQRCHFLLRVEKKWVWENDIHECSTLVIFCGKMTLFIGKKWEWQGWKRLLRKVEFGLWLFRRLGFVPTGCIFQPPPPFPSNKTSFLLIKKREVKWQTPVWML